MPYIIIALLMFINVGAFLCLLIYAISITESPDVKELENLEQEEFCREMLKKKNVKHVKVRMHKHAVK